MSFDGRRARLGRRAASPMKKGCGRARQCPPWTRSGAWRLSATKAFLLPRSEPRSRFAHFHRARPSIPGSQRGQKGDSARIAGAESGSSPRLHVLSRHGGLVGARPTRFASSPRPRLRRPIGPEEPRPRTGAPVCARASNALTTTPTSFRQPPGSNRERHHLWRQMTMADSTNSRRHMVRWTVSSRTG